MTLTHYTQSDDTDHDRAKRTITRTLANEARGRDNAIPSADLADRTPVSASTVRDLIPQIRREYGLPIGSASGYFIIDTHEEFVRQVERQREQARTSLRTARDIASAFNQKNGGP